MFRLKLVKKIGSHLFDMSHNISPATLFYTYAPCLNNQD